MLDETCARRCKAIGQWVISARSGVSEARGRQQPSGSSPLAPLMWRAMQRGPHLISATLIPTGVPGAPGQPQKKKKKVTDNPTPPDACFTPIIDAPS